MGKNLAIGVTFACVIGLFVLTWCTGAALPATVESYPTFNFSKVLTKGGAFQVVIVAAKGFARRALMIQNNNPVPHACWVFLGEGVATKPLSFLLNPGDSREWHTPFAPIGEIQATCERDGDTLYIEAQ